jgi:hypothetical protein
MKRKTSRLAGNRLVVVQPADYAIKVRTREKLT